MTKKERELKVLTDRLDRMGRVNNVMMDVINKSGLSLPDILMILEMLKDEVVNGFKLEVSAMNMEAE